MSHAPDHSAHPRSEADHIASRPIVLVGAGSLLIFLVASLAATGYLRLKAGERPPLPLPPEVGQSKVGMVEQQLFDTSLRGAGDTAARRARLEGAGWVDRKQGLVHIPIEAAMGLVAAGVRAEATVPPTAPPLSPAMGGPDRPAAGAPGGRRP